jgi:hypothetical protein
LTTNFEAAVGIAWHLVANGSCSFRLVRRVLVGPIVGPQSSLKIYSIKINALQRFLAETQGFEPWIPISEYNALAKRRLQPLGHVSMLVAIGALRPNCKPW